MCGCWATPFLNGEGLLSRWMRRRREKDAFEQERKGNIYSSLLDHAFLHYLLTIWWTRNLSLRKWLNTDSQFHQGVAEEAQSETANSRKTRHRITWLAPSSLTKQPFLAFAVYKWPSFAGAAKGWDGTCPLLANPTKGQSIVALSGAVSRECVCWGRATFTLLKHPIRSTVHRLGLLLGLSDPRPILLLSFAHKESIAERKRYEVID